MYFLYVRYNNISRPPATPHDPRPKIWGIATPKAPRIDAHAFSDHITRPSLFPYILPSITSLCRELPLRMCPIQFFCLVLITSITDLFSSTFFNIRSVFCSAYPLHPPPYPHFKSLYSFDVLLSHRRISALNILFLISLS